MRSLTQQARKTIMIRDSEAKLGFLKQDQDDTNSNCTVVFVRERVQKYLINTKKPYKRAPTVPRVKRLLFM